MAAIKPLVSVIMPTFNQARYIGDAINSVMSQTYDNWELIIIDNESVDGTREVINTFQSPKIKHVLFANYGVIAASRNAGIQRARGGIIAFLDSDDLWLPNKLRSAIDQIELGADFVCTNMTIFGEDLLEKQMTGFDPASVTRDSFSFILLIENFVSTSTVVVKLEALSEGFNVNPEFKTAEDFDLWLRIFHSRRIKCSYSREPLTRYRVHAQSSSSSLEHHLRANLAVIKKWFAHEKRTFREQKKRASKIYYYIARKHCQQGNLWCGVGYYARSLWLDPINLKAFAGMCLAFMPGKFSDFILSANSKRLTR